MVDMVQTINIPVDTISTPSGSPTEPRSLVVSDCRDRDGSLVGIRALVRRHQADSRACSQPVQLPRRLRIRRKCHEPRAEVEVEHSHTGHRRGAREQDLCHGSSGHTGHSLHSCAADSRYIRRNEHAEQGECDDEGAPPASVEQKRDGSSSLQLPRLLGLSSSIGGDKSALPSLPRILSSPRTFALATGFRQPVSVVLAPLDARGVDGRLNSCSRRLRRAASFCTEATLSSFCTDAPIIV